MTQLQTILKSQIHAVGCPGSVQVSSRSSTYAAGKLGLQVVGPWKPHSRSFKLYAQRASVLDRKSVIALRKKLIFLQLWGVKKASKQKQSPTSRGGPQSRNFKNELFGHSLTCLCLKLLRAFVGASSLQSRRLGAVSEGVEVLGHRASEAA